MVRVKNVLRWSTLHDPKKGESDKNIVSSLRYLTDGIKYNKVYDRAIGACDSHITVMVRL